MGVCQVATLKDVLKLKELKEQIEALYTEQDLIINRIVKEDGAGRFDFDLEEPIDGKRFIKLELTDTIKELQESIAEGKTMYKSHAIKPFSFKTMLLKNPPKKK